MPFKWRATFNFDYPLLDKPISIGNIQLYPGSPELDLEPHAVHYFEFETETIDRHGQKEAKTKYTSRLEELIEFSALLPYYTEVSFHSAVLLDCQDNNGFPASGINCNFVSKKPYIPAGQSPAKFREELITSGSIFFDIQSMNDIAKESLSRALRWLYRANDYRIFQDEKLIYRWIAFNSIYGLFNLITNNSNRGEKKSIIAFEEEFRPHVGQLTKHTDMLASFNLQLDRGQNQDVSVELGNAINHGDATITQWALICVYAARCSLFHGEEKPVTHISNRIIMVSASYLDEYLKKILPEFVRYCKQNS